jgi:hypothetical protein
VVKTTVYLPEELKARLERLARDQRRSEADLIRAAIAELVSREPPRPTLPLFRSTEPITDFDDALRGFGED